MTDRELMQQALTSLEGYARNCRCEGGGGLCDAGKAIKARLSQPEPEPVAWMYKSMGDTRFAKTVNMPGMHRDESVPLYTAPPQREWQGLTDDDIKTMWDNHIIPVFNKHGISPFVFARAIEAKLKDKNA